MTVRTFIDASYGVHQANGKSHTGCTIVIGEAWLVSAHPFKQKIMPKSCTDAEFVGLFDSLARAIHLKNFVEKQGYSVDPAIIYKVLRGTALLNRGGP